MAWLGFLGLAIWKSQSVSFSGTGFLALAAAIGITIFCVAKPLGGPKVDLSEPAHMLGDFVSRTNWALVLIGAILTADGTQVEPEHMPMHDQHRGTQPPGRVFQTRANQCLCGSSVGWGHGDLERIGVVAVPRRYDRSPMYDSHFRPTPLSMRG